ncbi:TBC1 domain family member 16 isoform X3 [Camelus ferus]|uniref:TBC1 domain family member 16 isoform X3 n=2 Tax=Camelus TaxID=9836 RepID=A0A8B8R5T7_CAMFR|nr:TBC1 domain family member 16 isoform X3 [Camelus ferus]
MGPQLPDPEAGRGGAALHHPRELPGAQGSPPPGPAHPQLRGPPPAVPHGAQVHHDPQRRGHPGGGPEHPGPGAHQPLARGRGEAGPGPGGGRPAPGLAASPQRLGNLVGGQFAGRDGRGPGVAAGGRRGGGLLGAVGRGREQGQLLRLGLGGLLFALLPLAHQRGAGGEQQLRVPGEREWLSLQHGCPPAVPGRQRPPAAPALGRAAAGVRPGADLWRVPSGPGADAFPPSLLQSFLPRLQWPPSDEACTSGQLVVASRESQYKVFHFHHGGLDKLPDVLQQWKYCAETHLKDQQVADEKTCMQFSIRRPKLPSSETHPEESMYRRLDVAAWLRHLNALGQVQEEYKLRKAIFFGGIDVSIRGEVWPFLLRYYSHESTSEEREALRAQKRREYAEIQQKRLSMTPEEHRAFWRNVQFTVDKDVVRTDRSHQFFRGEGNPNVECMRRILLNYAVYNPAIGYSQGMSDLVAPILAEVLDESDTFWCFVGLMQNTIFVSSPRDEDMEKQLLYLRELLRLTHLRFYQHLVSLGEDGLQMLFCHRWLLLCFKREFPEAEALRIWEACWAHYQTDYFHLFICVAIVAIYGDDVIEQQLATDQMLLHFGNLAMHMNGELVLRKARSLLYQFRLLPRIPCSLHDLCKLCGTGMWDSGYMPAVECTGQHPGSESCPFGGTVETPSPKPSREGRKGPKTPREGFGFRR